MITSTDQSSAMLGPETPGQFRLIACPSLSHERRTDRYFTAGKTVGECRHELGWNTEGLHARVFIDGQYIPDAEWLTAVPQPGQAVVVRRTYQGGGNGQGGGKQAAQIAAMLALTVASIYLAGGGAKSLLGASFGKGLFGANALAAGLLVGDSLALHGRIPAPLPRRALPRPMRELKEAA